MADRIAFIVERLNMSPFHKGFGTMSEFDGKSSLELLEILCEVVSAADPDMENIHRDATEERVRRIIQFLMVMKFNVTDDQMDDFHMLLMNGDKDILHTVLHWCLQRFDHLQKRAYLAKYLMPIEVPPEFQGEPLILDLLSRLKDMQADFKEVHKAVDQVRSTGARPTELRAEIAQLENERIQLQNKISRMKRDTHGDEQYFQEMLKVCRPPPRPPQPPRCLLLPAAFSYSHHSFKHFTSPLPTNTGNERAEEGAGGGDAHTRAFARDPQDSAGRRLALQRRVKTSRRDALLWPAVPVG
jgi:hypothetical protein